MRLGTRIRNTLYLTGAQVLAVPLSILVNAMAAHYLGAEGFGYTYLAATFCSFGFLLVGGTRGRSASCGRPRSPARGCDAGDEPGVAAGFIGRRVRVLTLICEALGYTREMHWALGLTALLFALNQFAPDTRTRSATRAHRHAGVCPRDAAVSRRDIRVHRIPVRRAVAHRADRAVARGGGLYSSRSGRPFAASESVACGCNGRSSSSCLSVARRSCC